MEHAEDIELHLLSARHMAEEGDWPAVARIAESLARLASDYAGDEPSPVAPGELLACPYCGEPGEIAENAPGWWGAWCNGRSCEVSPHTGWRKDRSKTLALWNTRRAGAVAPVARESIPQVEDSGAVEKMRLPFMVTLHDDAGTPHNVGPVWVEVPSHQDASCPWECLARQERSAAESLANDMECNLAPVAVDSAQREEAPKTWGPYHLHPDGWYRLYPVNTKLKHGETNQDHEH